MAEVGLHQRAPRPAPCHRTPAHPQEEKRRELNFLRIYWARGCPALQAVLSGSCTRDGLAGESVLRVPTTALLHFSECLLLLRPATLPWGPATGTPGSPARQVILAVFLALSGPLSAYPPREDVTSLSKDRSTPTQHHGFHGSRWGFKSPLSVSHYSCCSLRPLSLFPSGSNILRCQDLRPQGARHAHPLAEGESWTRAGSRPTHRPGTRAGSGGAGLLH